MGLIRVNTVSYYLLQEAGRHQKQYTTPQMLTITRTMRKCLNWGIEVVTKKKQRYECTLYFSLRESKAAGFHVVITDSRLH